MIQGIGDLLFFAFCYIYWITLVICSDYNKNKNIIYERYRKRKNTLDNNDSSRTR